MNCLSRVKEGAELLIDYCAGTLDSTRKVEIDRHIETCTECRRVVEAQRELWLTMDHWALDRGTLPEVSHDFDGRLYARIAQEQAAPSWSRWLKRLFLPAVPTPFWKPAISLAAACAVLAVGLAVRPSNVIQPLDTAKQIQAEHVYADRAHADNLDIEQVANTLDDLDLLTPASSSQM